MSTRLYKESHITCFITYESVCTIQDGACLKFKAELKWIVKVLYTVKCEVCSWNWQQFVQEKADHLLFVTRNPPPTLCRVTAVSAVRDNVYHWQCDHVLTRKAHIFQKARSHYEFLGARRVLYSKFHTKDLQILGTNEQNLVGTTTWYPGFVHPCPWLNPVILLVYNQLDALFQCIYLFHFSTCFEQPSAHHQENQLYQYLTGIYHSV